jgi:DNA repair exonuclease SbcCD ATPase subunit
MTSTKHSPGLALLLLGASLSFACLAQDDAHAREREALRRTQAALRQAQDQQAALSKEKDELASQRDKLDQAAKRTQSQLAASRADAGRLAASLVQAQDELAAATQRDELARQAMESRLAEQAQRLAATQRMADERARSNAALVALLEHATRSLAAAEKANQQMHALGLRLIDRIRGRDGCVGGLPADPVLGFGQIQLENEAEGLRDQLEAARLADTGRAGAAK